MRAALLVTLSLALAAPAFACDEGPSAPMLNDWTALLKSGCDLKKAHVFTPIEARALRNVPYAQAGYVFKSAELTALYAAEGWYTPKPGVKVSFTQPKVGACVKKLKALETSLKKTIPMKKAFVRRFMKQPDAVHGLRGMTSMFPNGIGGATYRADKVTGSETWDLTGAEDKNNLMQLICDSDSCMINTPG